MNIKIVHSWLKEYLETNATPEKIGEALSLSSVSVERIEKIENEYIYDIEVTTNRSDLMSVEGIAREAAVILPRFNIHAKYIPHKYTRSNNPANPSVKIDILNDQSLVNRILAVAMDVSVKEAPQKISKRITLSDIRSLNNLIDITNYVMRETGHPAHVFDLDRLNSELLKIRRSKKGEKIVTLDKKEYTLPGGDIVAEDGNGRIVDLLGIMGLENSVVTNDTKRILFFLDNNVSHLIRKTSMELGIRTEAAVLNEKGLDRQKIMEDAFNLGVSLYETHANGKIISKIIDVYPNKIELPTVNVNIEKINKVIGMTIPENITVNILQSLGFEITKNKTTLTVKVPPWRAGDVAIEEDIIEEIARVYGYHTLPSVLPPLTSAEYFNQEKDIFYWEKRIKNALKYWGFTETYTYSMVSADMYEGPISKAVAIKNPLNTDHVYMRNTLIPSLLQVFSENNTREEIRIFELANVYIPKNGDLPEEVQHLAVLSSKKDNSFYEMKGVVEAVGQDMGIELNFKKPTKGGLGADILIANEVVGDIELLDENTINCEINFDALVKKASLKKQYTPIAKYPPVIEDVRIVSEKNTAFAKVEKTIRSVSNLVKNVSILDEYENKKTYRIVFQSEKQNLTNEDVTPIREKIINTLETELDAKLV